MKDIHTKFNFRKPTNYVTMTDNLQTFNKYHVYS